jgi:GAF domain-containing protein
LKDETLIDDISPRALDDEPEGLSDLPRPLALDASHAMVSLALALGCVSAEVYRQTSDGRLHWLFGSQEARMLARDCPGAMIEKMAARADLVHLPGGPCRALAVPTALPTGEYLVLFGLPLRFPRRRLLEAMTSVRFCVRAIRSARQLEKLGDQSTSLSVTTEMLSEVLKAESLEDMLAVLAERIARATSSESAAIDSYDEANGELVRNLYTDPSWPDWELGAERWRQMLQIRVREWQQAREGGAQLTGWRQPLVVPDVQNPMVLATVDKDEAAFYVEAGLRTVVLVPLWVGDLFVGILSLSNRKVRPYPPRELEGITRMGDVAAVAIRGAQLMNELRSAQAREQAAYLESISRLAAAAEARDRTTSDHLRHVEESVFLLARSVGLKEAEAREVAVASTMHDIGKISMPDSILLKPGPLTEHERELVKLHTTEGEKLLTGAFLGTARKVARSHHERWDGSGYPDGLRGEEIPLAARVVSVADVYDALISVRPYKHAWRADEALAEIVAHSGSHFDPRVVSAFEEIWKSGAYACTD